MNTMSFYVNTLTAQATTRGPRDQNQYYTHTECVIFKNSDTNITG